jgi:diguanylate cyclase (GGDEF)-like protein
VRACESHNSPTAARGPQGRSAWRAWLGSCGALLLFWSAHSALAAGPDNLAELLHKADDIKLIDHVEFVRLLTLLDARAADLTPAEHEFFDYLHGWSSAYNGDYDAAIKVLEPLQDSSKDATLRFRAGATVVNVLSVAARYEDAYSRLNSLLGLLSEVGDSAARQQGLMVATYLYNEVGQYNLSARYAQIIIDENWAGKGICRGGQLRLEALYRSRQLRQIGPELQAALDACVRAGEVPFENALRADAAKVYLEQRRYDEVIALLQKRYDYVVKSGYRRMISDYQALLAQAYRRKSPPLARKLALDALESSVKNQFTQPLANAYGVLYELAKEQGDFAAALSYHEQYAAADKGYLDDVSARQLAYQKVNHENIANKLQVDALDKQNHVLQLERQLSSKAVETSRLYILLLTMTVLFIGLWAYRTKRSQLHFQSLSQLDGLTGICNRPHFIAQAEKALEVSGRTGGQLCIVLCDLDHFKSINDRYGHATGDFVLKRTVSACKLHLEKGEILGRFGGEEFAVLLPSCGPEEARQRAEQLRAAVAEVTVCEGTTRVTASASFGVASTTSSGHNLGQLLAHADWALYEAKRSGRNRVVVHSPLSDIPTLAIVSTTGEFVQYTGRSSSS